VAPPHDHEELLANVAWVREFALALARDPHVADDVTQQTFVAALTGPDAEVRSLRGWLAGVARRVLRQWRRSETRRALRERRAPVAEAAPSSLDLVDRAAAQRAVVGAVLELPEPYRTTVLMRFFEGLAPADIAAREGVPIATVYTRLSRAFERLRARLDRTSLAALLPWPSTPWLGSPAALGGAVVNVKVVVAAAAVVVLAAGFWIWSAAPAIEDVSLAARLPAAVAEQAEPAAASAAEGAPGRLANEAPAAATATPPSASAPAKVALAATRVLRGRVVDLDARGIGGVDVQLVSADETKADAPIVKTASDADGRFSFEAPVRPSRIEVASARWTTVLAGWGSESGEGERVVVVAPDMAFAGLVVDETDAPVVGASVEYRLPAGLRTSFREILDLSIDRTWSESTDARGRFSFAHLPQVPNAALAASRGGFVSRSDPAPTASAFDLTIVLRRDVASDGRLSGRVFGSSGDPIAGALVVAGRKAATTADDGSFVVGVAPSASRITAAKTGFLPVTAEAASDANGRRAWPEPLVLRLSEPARVLRGVVVDASGAPASSSHVWIRDASWLGSGEGALVIQEQFLGGSLPVVDTDAQGRFEIRGLLDRPYDLAAGDLRTLRIGKVDRVPAGASDVRIELASEPLHDRVAGHVVSPAGEPIAGVKVVVHRRAFEIVHPGGRGSQTQSIETAPALTDADGRFELRDVLREDVGLSLTSDAIVPVWLPAPFGSNPVDLRVEVLRRRHLKIELDAGDPAQWFTVLDASGKLLEISEWEGENRSSSSRRGIESGRTPVVAVAETARTVVFHGSTAELRRVPIELKPGAPTIVR